MALEGTSRDNAFTGKVHVEILNPHLIALSVPKNQPGCYTPLKFQITVTNNTSTSIYINTYRTFTPELMTPDGQVIPGHLANAQLFEDSDIGRADYLLVEPKSSNSSKSIALPARVCWQNDLLQLQISAFPEYYTEDFTMSGQFWIFDLLQLETYQIRFRYQNNLPDSFRTPSTNAREAETGQAIEPGPLLTSFASLYLAEPTGPLRGTVSVNGVQIETVTERVWHLPRKSLRLKLLNVFRGYYERYEPPVPFIPVQLGIRITNNTQKPLRFNLHNLSIPEIIGTDGQVPLGGYCIRAGGTSETDLPLIGIGETTSFWLDAVIFWHWGNQFGLRIAAYEHTCFWFLQPLKPGVYQLRFTYSNQDIAIVVCDLESRDIKLEYFWIGEVSIPPVEIRLVKP